MAAIAAGPPSPMAASIPSSSIVGQLVIRSVADLSMFIEQLMT